MKDDMMMNKPFSPMKNEFKVWVKWSELIQQTQNKKQLETGLQWSNDDDSVSDRTEQAINFIVALRREG